MSWSLVGHACATCGGRLLFMVDDLSRSAGGIYRCGCCGATTAGKPDGICGCGIKPIDRRGPHGFHCGPNPAVSRDAPAEIVVLFG